MMRDLDQSTENVTGETKNYENLFQTTQLRQCIRPFALQYPQCSCLNILGDLKFTCDYLYPLCLFKPSGRLKNTCRALMP